MQGHVNYIRFAFHISSIVLPVWWPLQIGCLHLCWACPLPTHCCECCMSLSRHAPVPRVHYTCMNHMRTCPHHIHAHTHTTHGKHINAHTWAAHTHITPHTHTHTPRDHPVCAVCVRDIGQCQLYFLSPHLGVEHHTAPVRKTVHL